MPKLGTKHFPYTPAGQAAYKAAKAAQKPSNIGTQGDGIGGTGGPPSGEKAERKLNVDAWVKKKTTGFKVAEHKTLKEAQSALADSLSESNVADLYPNAVWEKSSNQLVAKLWAMHKKASKSKGPKKK